MNNTETIINTTFDKITFEKPTVYDGKAMWNLVKNSTLDLNSAYKYLLMCEFFQETCIVAKEGDRLIGFVTAFIPPDKDDTLFVWQIGVDSKFQGQGIASKLLSELFFQNNLEQIHYLEATVTPTNIASKALFRGFAKKQNTSCEVSECFSEDLFPGTNHEAELLYRIGPIKKEEN